MSVKSKPSAKSKQKSKTKKIIWTVIWSAASLMVIGIAAFFFYIWQGLPSLEELENPKPRLASNVYSVDGEQIGQFFRENRIEIKIDSLPHNVIDAIIATEDRKFYDHWGVDLDRFVKAMIKNIFMFKREGASTITQQLAKNLYELKQGSESLLGTGIRKLREWITAVQIEKTYTKDEILEMYLNISYFGRGAYGIEMASRIYFGKSAKDLPIIEAAVLIPLLKNPFGYDPVRHYNNSLSRRNLVLYNMAVVGSLTEEEYDNYKEQPIKLELEKIAQGFRSTVAPHFIEYVRQQMESIKSRYGFDLYEDGLTIYTTLDTRMQNIAVNAATTHLDEFQGQFDKYWNWNRHRDILDDMLDKAIKQRDDYRKAPSEERQAIYDNLKKNVAFVDSVQRKGQEIEVGFVVLDTKTGEIRAMVGGRDQSFRYGLNHTTQIKRQPGSAFKPIIYAVAIDNGLYPAYPMLNQPFLYDDGVTQWSPSNDDNSTGGFTTLRDALKRSVNLITARLVIEGHVELWKVGQFADRMGIKTKLDLYPAITLGSSVVTPLEIASVYATFANKGIYNEPISILKIEDNNGIVIEQFAPQTREAIPEEVAYIVTDMLRTVINEGTGMRARLLYNFNRPAAGKTGTNQDYADAWFCGFTPQLAAATWVGFDDQRVSFTGSYGQGSRAALPIWAKFMHDVYDSLDIPLEDFQLPENGNVVTADFCEESIYELGDPKLYSRDCRKGVVSDIIRLQDIPNVFNSDRDTAIKIFDRYMIPDSMSHLATEIFD